MAVFCNKLNKSLTKFFASKKAKYVNNYNYKLIIYYKPEF